MPRTKTIEYALHVAREEIKSLVQGAAAEETASRATDGHAGKTVKAAKQETAKTDKTEVEVVPPQPGFGEFATPACFALARVQRKNPTQIASQLAEKINHSPEKKLVSKATAEKGYLNFHATDGFFGRALTQALEMEEKYGSWPSNGKVFAIEYSDPNVGKPFHVGHIRSTILGEAIKRLRAMAGFKTFAHCYLGDAGTQVAKLIVALDEFREMKAAKDEKELLQYYVKMHEESQKRPELEVKARETLSLIENGDAATLHKAEEIKKISLRGFEKNWKRLGVKFDMINGESQFIVQGKEVVSECLRKGIASRDEKGAVVLELESYGIPNTIIMREGGTTLYLTRDFGFHQYFHDKTKFDESLVITASEQNTHFRQLYKTLELLGRDFAPKCKHLGFGLVFLESGKISSREGRVVFLEDVLDQAVDTAKTEIAQRKLPYGEKESEQIANTVGVGSVKFAFLRVTNEKNITFDPAKATRFDGDTGAYVQYTCVRAANILKKAQEEGVLEKESNATIKTLSNAAKKGGFDEVEKKLALTISEFPLVVQASATAFQPHTLCDYLLRLAASFSEFYEKNPVLKAENKHDVLRRLALVSATRTTLSNGLELLGISVPQRM